jgi:F0F1-type ATP synthase membrane subunit b/b'
MIWIAAILLAAIPHVSNPFIVSALIFVAVALVAYHLKVMLTQLLSVIKSNQQKIYNKLG